MPLLNGLAGGNATWIALVPPEATLLMLIGPWMMASPAAALELLDATLEELEDTAALDELDTDEELSTLDEDELPGSGV